MVEVGVAFILGSMATLAGMWTAQDWELRRKRRVDTSEPDVAPLYFEGIGNRPTTIEEIEQKERANKSSAYYTS